MTRPENIFINCPYDGKYRANILPAITFATIYLGYEPRTASESTGSNERLSKIFELIRNSRLSIHDVSPVGDKLRRHNMPFELGLFMGASQFGMPPDEAALANLVASEKISAEAAHQRLCRSYFVIVEDDVSFETDFSDMKAVDPQSYSDPLALIEKLRTWLRRRELEESRPKRDLDRVQLKTMGLPGKEYIEFLAHYNDKVLPRLGIVLGDLEFDNLKLAIEQWIEEERRSMVSPH